MRPRIWVRVCMTSASWSVGNPPVWPDRHAEQVHGTSHAFALTSGCTSGTRKLARGHFSGTQSKCTSGHAPPGPFLSSGPHA